MSINNPANPILSSATPSDNSSAEFKMEVVTPPIKSSYYSGDIFDPTGMVIQGKVFDELSVNIPLDRLKITPSGKLISLDTSINFALEIGEKIFTVDQPINMLGERPPLEWWSPMMTSNTTPAPYSVSASSFWNGATKGYVWQAFTNANDIGWASVDKNTQWIIFDFGSVVNVYGIKLFLMSIYKTTLWFPSKFDVQLSLNNSSYTTVASYNGQALSTFEGGWFYEMEFGGAKQCRYVKLANLTPNPQHTTDSGRTGISEIQFYRSSNDIH